jgi:hypothetical protein
MIEIRKNDAGKFYLFDTVKNRDALYSEEVKEFDTMQEAESKLDYELDVLSGGDNNCDRQFTYLATNGEIKNTGDKCGGIVGPCVYCIKKLRERNEKNEIVSI